MSVVIPTHNRKEKLIRLLKSILQSNYPSDKLEIIVVDDASTDGTYSAMKNLGPQVVVIRTENEVFPARSRDIGARYATGKYLFFIDDDCVAYSDTINCLVEIALAIGQKAGIIAPVITYTKNSRKVFCAGGLFRPSNIHDVAHLYQDLSLHEVQAEHKVLNISYSPSAFLVKRSVYLEAGGFNYKDFPIAWEETHLALKVKRNDYQNVCATKALVFHDTTQNARVRSPVRAYYQGKSRTIFYRRYFRRKILLLPVYILGFFLHNKSANMTLKYLQGVMEGLRVL